MVSNRRLFLAITAIIAVLVFLGVFIYHQLVLSVQVVNVGGDYVMATFSPLPGSPERTLDVIAVDRTPSPSSIPDSYALSVPFTSQAPSGVWDALHEDACEEASLLMVKRYKEGVAAPTAEAAEQELGDLVQSESSFGYGLSITLEQLRILAEKKYAPILSGGKVRAIESPSDIKQAVASGHPVIVGAAGKILQNPNFKGGGPNYHMLVIIGYTPTEFITNDPGTRNGKGYRYSYGVLMDAIHDWNPTLITDGTKGMLTFN